MYNDVVCAKGTSLQATQHTLPSAGGDTLANSSEVKGNEVLMHVWWFIHAGTLWLVLSLSSVEIKITSEIFCTLGYKGTRFLLLSFHPLRGPNSTFSLTRSDLFRAPWIGTHRCTLTLTLVTQAILQLPVQSQHEMSEIHLPHRALPHLPHHALPHLPHCRWIPGIFSLTGLAIN